MLRRHLFVYCSATSVYALLSHELAEGCVYKKNRNSFFLFIRIVAHKICFF